ncbi:MAG: polysaccharide deacetylase family protein [Chloroflexi bacterium]|nr:polysaccharide deacetylase family protein [Chloroflexota bacterium]
MKQPSVPILMYHLVSPEPHHAFRKYTVTPKAFASHMRWLALAGYHPIDMDGLADARAGRMDLPSRPIIITFDDGYRDCCDHAVPLLQARRFTAVFYLPAGLMGKMSGWLLPTRGVEFPICDWQAVSKLKAAGFHCGSHGMYHPNLTSLSDDDCRRELAESRQLIEDHLGGPVRHLAYPYGLFDERVRNLAAETGYATACATRIGLSFPADDKLALHRVPVMGQDSLPDFIWRLHTGWPLRDWLRAKADDAAGRLRRKGVATWEHER